MTTAHEVSPEKIEKKFISARLPWLVAAAALVVYVATLNRWVSFGSLGVVVRLSGWIWQPELDTPVYWLVTSPFRLLPASAIPLALNLFSAVCATLTLALLARSVALLPHDRTEAQRLRERSDFALLSIRSAWLPPVLAALVCGLQLTFWENATVASREMLDLLLFAYIIRCLLEFRLDERQSWLLRASLVYGAAMANNWAMIGFFPAFLAVLVWLKGLSFFNLRFLSRMSLWGLAGLSLYLLLPLVGPLFSQVQFSFWQGLKANLAAQKQMLFLLPFNKGALFHGDRPLWVLVLPSLLPVLVMSIRWPSYFGDPSKVGVTLTTFIFHCVHGALLLVCAWVALDPEKFSPRHLLPGMALLTLYYLGALSVGYYSGYLLLVSGAKPRRHHYRPVPLYVRWINTAVTCCIWLLLVIAPGTLIYRGLPQIRITNGPMLRQYASFMEERLPTQGTVVLSDDPAKLLLLQSAMVQSGKSKDCLFLDTSSLKWPEYQRFLKKKYPQRWQSDLPPDRKQAFEPPDLLMLVFKLAETNSLYYVHPSFGYYFEVFYPQARGLVYKLNTYPTNSLLAPELSQELVAENDAFWTRVDEQVFQPLLRAITPPAPERKLGLVERLERRAHLSKELNRDASILATFYSQALDYWGVELQRHGQLAQAAAKFDRALALNPENVVARVNLECNRNLQSKLGATVQVPKSIEDEFGKYRNWNQVMGANGPFDEPSFCYEQGRVFARGGNYRQAAQQFARVKALAPENLPCRVWLAQLYVFGQMPDQALAAVAEIHDQAERLGLGRTNQIELLSVEAAAHLAKNDLPGTEAAIRTALQKYPGDEDILAVATQVYMNFGRFTNALATIEELLKIRPGDTSFLLNKGIICVQMNALEQAIAPLTKVVDMETNNSSDKDKYYNALLYRAYACLSCEKLEEAQRDYEALKKAFPTAYKVNLGLAEVAYRKKDTNAAVQGYQLCLPNVPTNSPEANLINTRLKELNRASP